MESKIMTQVPKISIITPIYKTEKYLDKCLSSLVSQTLDDIEFIWIDNAANDECRDIISKYANKRSNIKVINLTENVGYSGAMNLGIKEASGKFVGFCDSDDWVDEDYYEKLYSKVKSNTDVVYCEFVSEYPDGHKKYKKFRKTELSECKCALLEALAAGSIWNAIFSNKLIKENNIHFSLSKNSIYKDNYFAIQAAYHAKYPELLNNMYYHYVQRPGSTINNLSLDQQAESAYELLQEIFSIDYIALAAESEQRIISEFLLATLPVHLLKKFPSEMKPITNTVYFKELYKRVTAFSNPTIMQRIFSIADHIYKPYRKIRFLGLSIKLKTKKG